MRERKEREYRNNWEPKSDRDSVNGGESKHGIETPEIV